MVYESYVLRGPRLERSEKLLLRLVSYQSQSKTWRRRLAADDAELAEALRKQLDAIKETTN